MRRSEAEYILQEVLGSLLRRQDKKGAEGRGGVVCWPGVYTQCRHQRFGKEPTEGITPLVESAKVPQPQMKLTERSENNFNVVIIYYFLRATFGKVNILIVYPSVIV